MKSRFSLGFLFLALLLVPACSQEPTVAPQSAPDVATSVPLCHGGMQPFYTFAANHDSTSEAFTDLESIDPATGVGTIICPLGVPLYDPNKGISCPLGLVFDHDGTMYTIVNWLFGPSPTSQLARVDPRTGATTFIGDPYPQHYSSTVIDRHGDLYAFGFNRGPNGQQPPPVFVGDGCLYRINKRTGEAHRIGFTGLYDIMDMAFDSVDHLYGTTENNLYRINTHTGAATLYRQLTGVPVNPCGNIQLEVMSLGFDDHDVLYGSAIQGFAMECWKDTPFLKIDMRTGAVHVVGWTGQWYNHGGDFVPRRR